MTKRSEPVMDKAVENDPGVSFMGESGNAARLHRRRYKGRRRRVEVLFTDEEYAELFAGATEAGWTVAGWTATAALAAVRRREWA